MLISKKDMTLPYALSDNLKIRLKHWELISEKNIFNLEI